MLAEARTCLEHACLAAQQKHLLQISGIQHGDVGHVLRVGHVLLWLTELLLRLLTLLGMSCVLSHMFKRLMLLLLPWRRGCCCAGCVLRRLAYCNICCACAPFVSRASERQDFVSLGMSDAMATAAAGEVALGTL